MTQPENPYVDIQEVVECRPEKANQYLLNGYRLLAAHAITAPFVPVENPKTVLMKRYVIYVLGRPTNVKQFVPAATGRRR